MPERRFYLLFWMMVSLAVHLAYVWGLALVPESWLRAPVETPRNEVAVELISPAKDDNQKKSNKELLKEILKKEKQFVRQTETEETFLANNKEKVRFKSEKEQRVLLETRAREVGLTKNRAAEPRFLREFREEKARANAKVTPNTEASPKIKTSQTGLDYSEFKPLNIKKEMRDLGASSVGEDLPTDVSIGSFTALNTDRFTFYSFYARIEELVRFRWETKVKEAIESFNQPFLVNVVLKKNWVTKVEFLLTPHGEIHQAKVIHESGVVKFDQATVWAFRDARIFPNPPQEMIEDDGFIHLNYSFTVQLNNSSWAER
ncbi:MAG: TonB C-terminal domain-containing protein [Bdellovibrionaceae bacterium]|jgi:TonB family protein|nr:TonB C-terminal domain-containing protein [Pseudobdellovibrionaceae bacterium]